MSAQLKELLFPKGKIHTGEPEDKLRPSLSNSCAAGMRPSSLHCVSRLRPRPPLQNGNNPCPTGVSACESLRAQPSSNVKTMTLFAQEQQLKFAGGFTVFRNVHGQFLCNPSPSENTSTSALLYIFTHGQTDAQKRAGRQGRWWSENRVGLFTSSGPLGTAKCHLELDSRSPVHSAATETVTTAPKKNPRHHRTEDRTEALTDKGEIQDQPRHPALPFPETPKLPGG